MKHQLNAGRRKEIYYFRDQQGVEVDLVVPGGDGGLVMIEAKASRTVRPAMARSLTRLRPTATRYEVTALLVHEGPAIDPAAPRVQPGVRAMTVDGLAAIFAPPRRGRR